MTRSHSPQEKRGSSHHHNHYTYAAQRGGKGYRSQSKRSGATGSVKPNKPTYSKATPARLFALEVLREVRRQGCYLDQAWNRLSKGVSLPAAEKAFARLLTTEVTARKGSLDELINSVLRSPSDIDDDVRDALRISYAELFYLLKPNHVAVNEGVELVRSFAPQATGLANFVLRRGVDLKQTFPFKDSKNDDYAAALQEGFPQWLADRLIMEFGAQQARTFMAHANNPAPLFFMVNQAGANGPQILKQMVEHGIKVAPVGLPDVKHQVLPCFVFGDRRSVADPFVSKLLRKASVVISDGAAQSVAHLAVPAKAPGSFLEIGAGRGTKTIMLQNVAHNRFGKQMALDSVDIDHAKTKERANRLAQANISQRESFVHDACDLSVLGKRTYDAVFIDAPCSGLGTLRRHPDIRWRLTPEGVTDLAATGLAMLTEASKHVASKGQLTYATCTVLHEENEDVIDAFLASKAGADFEKEATYRCADMFDDQKRGALFDGHFACVLKRRS